MSGTCIGLEIYARASIRPCLGHGIGLDDASQCKTMSRTWHRHLIPY
ncbi:hypothetical protein F383_05775 [Gossypium arboreum]|uniref:Uncharacterized protein n=1 Tax=Gossypium arboreum TaxID=29729 RepID=A0A0B0NCM7_GOSAR|nr:hypothetical protein F383_05775 [Gossypium arboreum]